MINLAKSRNKGAFYNFSFTEIDKLSGPFEGVYCIGNSLSYLPSSSTDRFLKDVYRLLNDFGYFVIQVVNWDKFQLTEAADFPIKTLADGRTFHRSYERLKNSTVLFHTELRKEGEIQSCWSDTLYPKYLADMASDIKASGMILVDKFGDYDKSPFIPLSSPATILVAQKAAK
ncbi:MAG: class I SAM-dependent methyltransferase, partial [candidate division Zixibacteria bacterium]|nr:class I SAM-dependent methyltransferase [candidate division Zixibacteria bacterium]